MGHGLADAPSPDLFVQLGQFAGQGDATVTKHIFQVGQAGEQPVGRFEGHQRVSLPCYRGQELSALLLAAGQEAQV